MVSIILLLSLITQNFDNGHKFTTTGDESPLKLWIGLFVVSFIILAILIYKFLKKLYIK